VVDLVVVDLVVEALPPAKATGTVPLAAFPTSLGGSSASSAASPRAAGVAVVDMAEDAVEEVVGTSRATGL